MAQATAIAVAVKWESLAMPVHMLLPQSAQLLAVCTVFAAALAAVMDVALVAPALLVDMRHT